MNVFTHANSQTTSISILLSPNIPFGFQENKGKKRRRNFESLIFCELENEKGKGKNLEA